MHRLILSGLLLVALAHPVQAQDEVGPCEQAFRHLEAGAQEDALISLESCLEDEELIPAQEVLVYTEIGAIHLYAERFEAALGAHAMAAAIAETAGQEIIEPAFFRNRGIAYSGLNDPERALVDLRRAYAQDNQDPLTLVSLGIVHQDMGAYAEAVEVFDALIRVTPDWPGAWLNRSAAFLDLGMTGAAVSDAERALEIEPDSGLTLNMLCWTLVQDGRARTALPLCERAVELEPEAGSNVHSLAAALEATGSERRAYRLYREAYRLSPDDPEIIADYERTNSP